MKTKRSLLIRAALMGAMLISSALLAQVGIGTSSPDSSAALDAANMVQMEVSVTDLGAWSVATDTVNGYSLAGNGIFFSGGTQMITLYGSGTSVIIQTDQFTATGSNDGGACVFSVTVASQSEGK